MEPRKRWEREKEKRKRRTCRLLDSILSPPTLPFCHHLHCNTVSDAECCASTTIQNKADDQIITTRMSKRTVSSFLLLLRTVVMLSSVSCSLELPMMPLCQFSLKKPRIWDKHMGCCWALWFCLEEVPKGDSDRGGCWPSCSTNMQECPLNKRTNN